MNGFIERLRWSLAAGAVALSGVIGVASAGAQGTARSVIQPAPVQRVEPRTPLTPPPLPFNANPFASPTPAPSGTPSSVLDAVRRSMATRSLGNTLSARSWQYAPNAPRLPVAIPALTVARTHLRQQSQGRRRIQNASGGTIILNGSSTLTGLGQTMNYGWDGTVAYGATENLQCLNMAAGTYQYYVFPPKSASAIAVGGTVTVGGGGACPGAGTGTVLNATLGPAVTFSTPYGTGSDPAYASVWAIGLYNTTAKAYQAITFVDVEGSQHLTTSTDNAGTNVTSDFVPGSTIYVSATGLNTGDSYAFGFVNTASVTNNKCVYTIPNVTVPGTGPCFNNGVTVPGLTEPSGSVTVPWNTSVGGGTTPGTYMVQLYDATLKAVVGTTQVSLEATATGWTMIPYSSTGAADTALTNGYGGIDVYAFDGSADQSVSGLDMRVTGLTTNDNVTLSVSDPNGAVLTSPVLGRAAATTDFGEVVFPLKAGVTYTTGLFGAFSYGPFYPYQDVFGPTAIPNGANVYTAQVYDRTSGAPVASKSFILLGYFGSFAWPSGVSIAQPASGRIFTQTVTISNTGYGQLGNQNADALVGFKINGDGTNESVSLPGGVTTETITDTQGAIWNVALTNTTAGGTITITPQSTGTALMQPALGTLSIPIVVSISPGQCQSTNACALSTQILPQHGISYSGASAVSNTLPVAGPGASAAASGNFEVRVTAQPTQFTPTQRFNQMMYLLGTGTTTSASSYSLNYTAANPNNGEQLIDALVTLPTGVNAANVALAGVYVCSSASVTPPAECTATTPGVTTQAAGSWVATSAVASGIANATTNQVYVYPTCVGNNGCGIAKGNTVGFLFTLPMWTQTGGYQDTAFEIDPDGGCPATATNNGWLGGFTGTCTPSTTPLTFTPYPTSTVSQNSPVNASGTNLDSSELAIFSLDPTTMTAPFQPSMIGAGVTTSTTMNFTNTPTSSYPNPDYVDQIMLTVPYGAIPSSITIPATSAYAGSWTITQTAAGASPSTPATYTIADNCLPACATSNNVTNAIAPGGQLPLQFNYTGSQTNGTYPVTFQVEGANGGELSATATSNLVISSLSANVQFSGAGGYPNTTTVPAGTEPQVGSDAAPGIGNAFDYRITNNGSTAITSIKITIPYQNRYGITPPASEWPNTTNPLMVRTVSLAGSAGCVSGSPPTPTLTLPTASAAGSITFTCPGGSFNNGQYVDVLFDMQMPYDIGSEYQFDTTLNGTIVGTATYPGANLIDVVLNAALAIYVPTTPSNMISLPSTGGTATATCLGCVVTQATGTTPADINFGAFTGTFTGRNLVNASVTSDASGTHSWQLYVSVDTNPTPASGGSPMLQGEVNPTYTSSTLTAAVTTFTTLPTTTPGLQITSFSGGGTLTRNALDTLMDFQVNGTGDVGMSHTVLVTYTLIPN